MNSPMPSVADLIRDCFEDATQLTVRGLFDAIEERGYSVRFATIKRTVGRMVKDNILCIAGRQSTLDKRVFELNLNAVALLGESDARLMMVPAGVLPTARLDPMAWIVFTSGVQEGAPA